MTTNNNDLPEISGGEQDTLKNAGVDVSAPKGVSDPVDLDSAVNGAQDADLKDVGISFVDKSEPSPSAPQAESPWSAKASTQDLEHEFQSAVGGTASPTSTPSSFDQQAGNLKKLLSKIKEKLGLKKNEVKQELESLKKVKENIAGDIQHIKDLEESEHKIEEQVKKIETLSEEMKTIEHEVTDELKP